MRVLAPCVKNVATPLPSGRLLLLGTHSKFEVVIAACSNCAVGCATGESGFHSRTRQGYSSSPHLDRLCYVQSPLSSGYQRLHRGSGDRDVISCTRLHLMLCAGIAITSPCVSHVCYQFGTGFVVNPYPTAFPYGNSMVLHFYQQQESSTTKTVHKAINKRLKTYV